MPNDKEKSGKSTGANLGFEAQLWAAADALRNNMDAAEYKHVVLGLIFLKYISDAFAERYDQIVADPESGADPEDRDEYLAEGVFWVPPEARWDLIKAQARQPNIGVIIDGAMDAIERENPTVLTFKGVSDVNERGWADDYYQTQYKLLQGRSLARKVIEELDLVREPEFGADGAADGRAMDTAIDVFLDKLSVQWIRNSRLVVVGFESRSPELAAGAANTLARAYIAQTLEAMGIPVRGAVATAEA